MDDFEKRNALMIGQMAKNTELRELSKEWFLASSKFEYSYHFTWLGRPIIQFPQDIIAMQEVIWKVKPEVIIETGIARGGSLVFYASLLELIGGAGQVIGVDVDIRQHNRIEIEKHPMAKRITMLEGSSIDVQIVTKIQEITKGKFPILVVLDSNHTHAHVRKELDLYAPFVSIGSYLVVFDTVIEDTPKEFSNCRPWGPSDNPKTAVIDFLKSTDRFIVDEELENKLLVTVSPSGYLKCVKS